MPRINRYQEMPKPQAIPTPKRNPFKKTTELNISPGGWENLCEEARKLLTENNLGEAQITTGGFRKFTIPFAILTRVNNLTFPTR